MHRFEGCRNKPYLCPAHIWTIGYGHVLYQEQIRLPMVAKEGQTTTIRKELPLRQEDNRVWSKEEIEKLFADDVNLFERGVLRLAPTLSGFLNVVFYDLLLLYLVIKGLSMRVSLLPSMPDWAIFSGLLFG